MKMKILIGHVVPTKQSLEVRFGGAVAQRERKLLGADTVSMKFVQMMKMK
jgi:hypothetical protein